MKETGTIRPADVPADTTSDLSGMAVAPHRGDVIPNDGLAPKRNRRFIFIDIMKRFGITIVLNSDKEKPPDESST